MHCNCVQYQCFSQQVFLLNLLLLLFLVPPIGISLRCSCRCPKHHFRQRHQRSLCTASDSYESCKTCRVASYTAPPRQPCHDFVCCASKGLKHGMLGGFLRNTSVFLTPRIGAWPNWSKTLGHQSLLPGMELTKQHIMSSRCHAKPRCWANIFGPEFNSL